MGGIKFKVCPLGVITEESVNFFNLFTICKEFNKLPENGGIYDQDNRTMQAFEIIANESAMIENKEMKKLSSNNMKNTNSKGVK